MVTNSVAVEAATIAPSIEARIRQSFYLQSAMQTFGVELISLHAGVVTLEMPFNPALTQQNGFLHAGVVTTLVDSACGYAALSVMPEGSEVLSVEFKVNLMSPAAGERFRAVGRVVKSGKTLSVCTGEVIAINGQSEKTIALMQATMFRTTLAE